MSKLYKYRCLTIQGVETGVLWASSISEALLLLGRQGQEVISCQRQWLSFWRLRRLTLAEQRELCLSLSGLLLANIPLVQALKILVFKMSSPYLQALLKDVLYQLETGHSLTQALRKRPQVFPLAFIEVIAFAELTGKLTKVLQHFGNLLHWQQKMQRQKKKALIYPTFLGVMILAVAWIIGEYLLPELHQLTIDPAFSPAFNQFGFLSLFSLQFFTCVFFAFIVSIFVVRIWFPGVKKWLAQYYYFLPGMGHLAKLGDFTYWSYFMALQLQSQVPLILALERTSKAQRNTYLQQELRKIRDAVASGASLSQAFKSISSLAPAFLCRMIQLGEETGELSKTLERAASFLKEEHEYKTEALIALMEPLMLGGMGCLLLAMIFFVLFPMYGALTGIG